MATPPFGAPDEQAHYLRALTITNGRLLGPRVRVPSLPAGTPAWRRKQLAWINHDARGVQVPAKLAPPGVPCLDGRPNVGRTGCVEAVENGDYPPLAYLLPSLALRSAGDATTGDWLGRAASALPVLGLLLIAVAMMAPLGGWSLLGLLVAMTPMVLFVGAILNSSGLDIAASLACVAAALRLAVAPERASKWVWAALMASGVVAILSWQLGPWFVLLALMLSAAVGRRSSIVRAQPRWAIGTGLGLASAFALYLAYGLSSGLMHASVTFTPVGGRVKGGVQQFLHNVLPDAVGNFGWRTVQLPSATYWIWWLCAAALFTGALCTSRRRVRLVLAASAGIAVAFPVLFFAFVYGQSGFGLQGRQMLPVLMLVPLLAGCVLQQTLGLHGRLTGSVVSAGLVVVAGFQLFAWWINARQSAGAQHSVWFLAHPLWSPPLGWWPWAALAVIGTASLVGAALRLRVAPPITIPTSRAALSEG